MFTRILVATAMVALMALPASAGTLQIANYNVANHPNNAEDQAQLRTILGYASPGRPIDLLSMSETDAASAVDTASVFGGVFGGTYTSVVAPADGGGDRTGFVYNAANLTLVGTSTVGVGTLTHPTLRARFRPAGTHGSADYCAYAVHLLSGDTAAIRKTRVTQAQLLRTDADALGSANVIVAGDSNWHQADEVSTGVGAYRTFAAAGVAQVTDPLNRVGKWQKNAAFADLLSEDPDTNLDDRFDMQLTSARLLDGRSLDYVPGTYRVVGNQGTVSPGGVIAASATLPATVVSAMGAFSDHLPVLADYQFPAVTLDGDADLDGGVSISDFNLLAANFGRSVLSTATPFDMAGLLAFAVAHDDLVAFQVATGVPEPGALGVLIAAVGFAGTRRARCRH